MVYPHFLNKVKTLENVVFSRVFGWTAHKTFDYNGKTKLAKTIVEGVAEYVTISDGGTGLDVGCGSGALTVAVAKRNPNARMIGCDIWSGAYMAIFSKKCCEGTVRF